MEDLERFYRHLARVYRSALGSWAQPRAWLDARAAEYDFFADLEALRGLDLADLFAPTPGDALALRGGPLATERGRTTINRFDKIVSAARDAAVAIDRRGEG